MCYVWCLFFPLPLQAILTEQEGGSIAGGGRYDGLIGVFSHKPIPAVGASIGIARILALLANSSNKCVPCTHHR